MRINKKTIESEIFTGSMADVSFLLIIYFMVTSVFSATRGLDFQLPEDNTNTPEIKREDSIDIHVMAGDVIKVDGKQMSIDQILPYIADKLKQNPDKPVILRTDPDATYNDMIQVFDLLRQAPDKIGMEIKTISIPTQREIQNVWALFGMQ
ncbi:MAG: biopolymer transporter ExbD [Acidobacteria bacterium]|nr:biopolymer transporter ExbD [Acidobacteriota bacterium]